jgi:probable HAF family extracellular repeat protein
LYSEASAGGKEIDMKKRTKVWLSVPLAVTFAFFLMFSVTPATPADSWTFVSIDVPNAVWTLARHSTPSGMVVGAYKWGPAGWQQRGYLLTAEGFSDISEDTYAALGRRVDVRGVNSRGDIVGQTSDPLKFLPMIYRGFLLSKGNVTWIDVPSGQCPADVCTPIPGDINEKGDVVGFYVAYTMPGWGYHSEHGFLWSHGVFTTLDATPLGAIGTNLRGINPDGDIVGVYDTDGTWAGAFLRRYDGTFAAIAVPGATGTSANAINPAGQIVGDYATGDGKQHGFLLSEGEFTLFDYPGAVKTWPFGISANGWIVGFYDDSDTPSVRHGFLVSRKGLE